MTLSINKPGIKLFVAHCTSISRKSVGYDYLWAFNMEEAEQQMKKRRVKVFSITETPVPEAWQTKKYKENFLNNPTP